MPSRLTVVLVSLLVATPAVIFWLWLVIWPARVAILCPEGCWCDTGGYYVSCYNLSLNNIPSILPTNVRVFLLEENNITILEKDSFISRGLTELEEIVVKFCQLETIELGAFSGLTKLTDLTVWGNEISEILPGTFDNMSRLESLHLEYNIIEYLEIDVFSGLINLIYIDLRGNNLQYLHPDTFAGLPSLQQLVLVSNPDLQIPTDRYFIKSPSLTYLEISECNVSSVSVETFANVTALEWLDLRYNNLSSVDINILKVLPKLSAMFLYDNPLQCDCQLLEVWRWCQEHNIETAFQETPPECHTPSDVQGMGWGVLEKGQCLQGNIYYYGDYKNTSYSDTTIEDLREYVSSFLERYELPLYAVPFIFGTTGNVILLIIIICNKHMRTLPNMYILNLAISDMIYLIVLFAESWANIISDSWKYDRFMCKFFPFCRRLSVGLSAYSVAVLSIQRYRVIVNPLHVRVSSQQTWRATAATICGVWIVAALFALPSTLSRHLCFVCVDYYCEIYYQRVVLFELLVSCVLPLCVIAFSYIMTARHLLKSARPISEETRSSQVNSRTNTAKTVLALTAVFVISSVPYHGFWTYIIFSEYWYYVRNFPYIKYYNRQSRYPYLVSTCLLLINPCFNPVALFFTGRAFRRQFKRYFIYPFKVRSRVTEFELVRRN